MFFVIMMMTFLIIVHNLIDDILVQMDHEGIQSLSILLSLFFTNVLSLLEKEEISHPVEDLDGFQKISTYN